MDKEIIKILSEVPDELNFHRETYPFTSLPHLKMPKAKKLYITDTTLRDGQQGWRPLTVKESVEIYKLLSELDNGSGVILSSEFFLYTAKDREVIREVKDLGLEYPKPVAWIRATMKDLRLAIENGMDKVVMLTSISDYHIYFKFKLGRRQVLEKYLSVIEEAFRNGIAVRATLEDATRADVYGTIVPFVKALLKLGEKYGVEPEIKIADTLGLGVPFEEAPLPRSIPKLVRTVISETGIPGERVEFHGHNDFHLVVANHLAAWKAGASMSNCTLFGIGERSGNCPLDAMVLFYVQLTGNEGGVNLKVFKKIRDFFEHSGYVLPEFYPAFGANAFRTKAGIHIDGLMKNPEVYLPYDPVSTLGLPYLVSITPYSGRAGVAFWIRMMFHLEEDGMLKADERVAKIYDEIIKMFSDGRVHPLRDEEMIRLVKKHMPEFYEKHKDKLPPRLRNVT